MKKIVFLLALIALVTLTGCSHNAAVFGFGKVVKLGNMECELLYVNGIAVIDYSRENSSWEMEIDDEDGLSYDPDTNTVKGIKKVKRTIGTQITGYLVDLAEKDPTAAEEYLSKDPMAISVKDAVNKGKDTGSVPEDPLKADK